MLKLLISLPLHLNRLRPILHKPHLKSCIINLLLQQHIRPYDEHKSVHTIIYFRFGIHMFVNCSKKDQATHTTLSKKDQAGWWCWVVTSLNVSNSKISSIPTLLKFLPKTLISHADSIYRLWVVFYKISQKLGTITRDTSLSRSISSHSPSHPRTVPGTAPAYSPAPHTQP